jgi:hypothetical protein
MYASQAYDVALLVDAAVKQIGGKVEDKDALRKALREAKFDATRGKFRFNKNNFPIQDYYLREVYKGCRAAASPTNDRQGVQRLPGRPRRQVQDELDLQPLGSLSPLCHAPGWHGGQRRLRALQISSPD